MTRRQRYAIRQCWRTRAWHEDRQDWLQADVLCGVVLLLAALAARAVWL